MLKKISNAATCILFSLFIVFSNVFIDTPLVGAAQKVSTSDMVDDTADATDNSNDEIDRSKISEVPDLGDDQAFPFIPGFGKNSGKD